MKQKLKSRKLWVALGGLLTVVAIEWIGIGPEIAEKVIGAVVAITCAYVGGQGLVDALAAYAKGTALAGGDGSGATAKKPKKSVK